MIAEPHHIGFAISMNAGGLWTDGLLAPPDGLSSDSQFDPMTAYDDRTGTLWAGGIFRATHGPGPDVMFVARKDPGQNTFQPSRYAYQNTNPEIDKGWMAAGPAPGIPNSTQLYIAFNLGVVSSSDMGETWTGNPVSLGAGVGFLPRVGPGGVLYVAYWDNVNDQQLRLKLRRSFNGGVTFDGPFLIATRLAFWIPEPFDPLDPSAPPFPGDFRQWPFAYLAVDGNDGTLYCVYEDVTSGVDPNENVDLWFTKSTNQGVNWTTPVVINTGGAPPSDQLWPWIEVDHKGRLHMVFLDSRNSSQGDYTV